MYFLMNKDTLIAKIQDEGVLSENFTLKEKVSLLTPPGMKNINDWIENRKASKHNASLRKIMAECGCETKTGFIKITHAASLNDTFWIKAENESLTWRDISLYQNEFNETISRLAFEGVGLQGFQFSDTSPELSTEGSFKKCWRKEEDGIYLYKRGSEGAHNAGLEPYCEKLASEIAEKLCKNYVSYNLVKFHKELATKCKLFTDEKYGYVPMARIDIENKSLDTVMKYFESIGSEDDFRRMLVLDAITFNIDRHMGNYGVLVDNDNLMPIQMAPVFDLNLSLLPYIEEDEFSYIGNKMLGYGPRLGDDFTRIGQLALTPEIRKDLINLKDFQFDFEGDQRFTKNRIKFLEGVINKQIQAILSKDKLYTKDVFVPEIKMSQEINNTTDFTEDNIKFLEQLKLKLENKLDIKCFLVETEDRKLELDIVPKGSEEITFCVDIQNNIIIKESDSEISYDLFLLNHENLASVFSKISKILDRVEEQDIGPENRDR